MRAGALAAVSIVAACLGAAAVLVVGSAAGWVGDDDGVRTVVVPTVPTASGAATPAAAPLLGNGFDPAKIYANRSEGVVTIYSYFPNGQRAQGSGFIVSEEGHILTNSHVVTTSAGEGSTVKGAERIYVVFHDGDRIPGTIVGWDLFNDTGLVKVDPKDHAVSPVPLGDSSRVVVGEPVAAIGSPFGEQGSLSIGVVSAKNRTIEALTDFSISDAIQTDAAVNRGNSGGPLLDAHGRVIGINAQIRSTGGGSVGVGFAISVDNVRRSIDQIRNGGEASYAYIGISSQNLYPQLAKRLNVPVEDGALIADVVKNGPADKAGIKGGGKEIRFQASLVKLGGDVITRVNGRRVTRENDFSEQITRFSPGDTISVELYRGNERRTARVMLGERPDQIPNR
jgi:2-alkenal reductase